jgi:hypothetical protein
MPRNASQAGTGYRFADELHVNQLKIKDFLAVYGNRKAVTTNPPRTNQKGIESEIGLIYS